MKAEGDRVACRYRLVGWPRRIPSGDLSRKVGRVTVSCILVDLKIILWDTLGVQVHRVKPRKATRHIAQYREYREACDLSVEKRRSPAVGF